MNSTQAVIHPAFTPDFTPSRDLSPRARRLAAAEEDAIPLDEATPMPHDLNASAVCVVRVAAIKLGEGEDVIALGTDHQLLVRHRARFSSHALTNGGWG